VRRISNRLLVRTALLLALLLIISHVMWIAVGSLILQPTLPEIPVPEGSVVPEPSK
jgi:hypothetical protein